jgi:tRNA (Thr-GGU) A37 N-methylase
MEDDNWDAENIHVELDRSRFSSEAFTGLATFSHVEIVFYLDQCTGL